MIINGLLINGYHKNDFFFFFFFFKMNSFLKNLIFLKISFNGLGGAIYFNNYNFNLKILNCLFQTCQSKEKGGAIYCKSNLFNLNKIIFNDCTVPFSISSGQSFYSESYQTLINLISINYCSYTSNFNAHETIFLLGGFQKIEYLNSSNNIAKSFSSGLATTESIYFNLKYSQFYNDSSYNHIFALIHIRPDDDILFNNIISNKVNTDGLIYLSGGFSIFFKCLFLNNEGLIITINNSYGKGYFIFNNFYFNFNKLIINSLIKEINCEFNITQKFENKIHFFINLTNLKNY